MDGLLALRVIASHSDKTPADRPAIEALLRALDLDEIKIPFREGAYLTAVEYVAQAADARGTPVEVPWSARDALTLVATVLILTGARAAADTLGSKPVSGNDRSTTDDLNEVGSVLENLLEAFVDLPSPGARRALRNEDSSASITTSISSRLRRDHVLGFSSSPQLRTSRRATARTRRHLGSKKFRSSARATLGGLHIVLRICDVANHALGVCVRNCLTSLASCERTLEATENLLWIASRLPCTAPAQVRRQVLANSAMHVGMMAGNHLGIDPSPWLRAASQVIGAGDSSVWVSVLLAPMYGGLLNTARSYVDAELDQTASDRMLVAMDAVLAALTAVPSSPPPGSSSLAEPEALEDAVYAEFRVAAHNFLGERVVASEDVVIEVDVTGMTREEACDEFSRMAMPNHSTLDVVLVVLKASATQCAAEVAADLEQVKPLASPDTDGVFNSAFDALTPRSENQYQLADVFDLRSPIFATVPSPRASARSGRPSGAGSAGAPKTSCAARADTHRMIGALAIQVATARLETGETLALHATPRAGGSSLGSLESLQSVALSVLSGIGQFPKVHLAAVGMADSRIGAAPQRPAASENDSWTAGLLSQAQSSRRLRSDASPLLDQAALEFADVIGSAIRARTPADFDWHGFAVTIGRFECNPEVLRSVLLDAPPTIVSTAVAETLAARLIPGAHGDASRGLACAGADDLIEFCLDGASLISHDAANSCIETCVDVLENVIIVAPRMSRSLRISATLVAYVSFLVFRVLEAHDSPLMEYLQGLLDTGVGSAHTTREGLWQRLDSEYGDQLRNKVQEFVNGPQQLPAHTIRLLERLKNALICYVDILTEGMWNTAVVAKSSGGVTSLQIGTNSSFVASGDEVVRADHALATVLAVSSFTRRAIDQVAQNSTTGVPVRLSATPIQVPSLGGSAEGHGVPMRETLSDTLRSVEDAPSDSSALLILAFDNMRDMLTGARDVALRELYFVDALVARARALRSSRTGTDGASPQVRTLLPVLREWLGTRALVPVPSAQADFAELEGSTALEALALHHMLLPVSARLVDKVDAVLDVCGRLLMAALHLNLPLEDEDLHDLGQIISRIGTSQNGLLNACRCLLLRNAALRPGLQNAERHEHIYSCVVEGWRIRSLVHSAVESRRALDAFSQFASAELQDSSEDVLAVLLETRGWFLETLAPKRTISAAEAGWLARAIPHVSLDAVIEHCMNPPDRAAVSVETALRALKALKEACGASAVWRCGVNESLNRLSMPGSQTPGQSSFFDRVAERSVVESGSMAEVLIEFAQSAVAGGIPEESPRKHAWMALAVDGIFDVLSRAIRAMPIEALERSLVYAAACLSLQARDQEDRNVVESLIGEFCFRIIRLASDLWVGATYRPSCSDCASKCECLLELIQDIIFSLAYVEDAEKELAAGREPTFLGDGFSVQDLEPTKMLTSLRSAALDSTLCTFTQTGSQFVEQHWYFCYTCGLTGSEGVCSVCAEVCHAGHDLSYSKHSRFFCDCGATSTRPSAGAGDDRERGTTRQSDETRVEAPPLPVTHSRSSTTPSGSQEHPAGRVCKCLRTRGGCESRDAALEAQAAAEHSAGRGLAGRSWAEALKHLVPSDSSAPAKSGEAVDRMWAATKQVVDLASRAMAAGTPNGSHPANQEASVSGLLNRIAHGLLGVECSFAGAPDISRLPAQVDEAETEHSSTDDESRTLNTRRIPRNGANVVVSSAQRVLGNGSQMRIRSRLAYSSSLLQLVVVEASEKLSFYSVSVDGTKPPMATFESLQSLGHFDVGFPIVDVQINETCSDLLAVAGVRNVAIYKLSDTPKSKERVELSLGLEDLRPRDPSEGQDEGEPARPEVVRIAWVPGKESWLVVATQEFVKVFDVYDDVMCPIYYAETPDTGARESNRGRILDSTVLVASRKLGKSSDSLSGKELQLWFITETGLACACFLDPGKQGPCNVALTMNLVDLKLLPENSRVTALCTTRFPDLVWISTKEGKVVVMSPSFEVEAEPVTSSSDSVTCPSAVQWSRTYTLSTPPPERHRLVPVGGMPSAVFCISEGQELSASTFLRIRGDGVLSTDALVSIGSAAVAGVAVLRHGRFRGCSRTPGALILLEDGNLGMATTPASAIQERNDRVYYSMPFEPRAYVAEEAKAERAVRKTKFRIDDPDDMFNPLPSTVGIFEGSRPVGDDVSAEGNFNRVSRSERGERSRGASSLGRETFVCKSPRETMTIRISCSNRSLTLVGLRVQVGGSERTRNQAPGEMRVFGRQVSWTTSAVQLRRWIDVPFTVPEAIRSPREVVLELEPRKLPGDAYVGDGTVEIDSIEVYAVRNGEMAKRKSEFKTFEVQYRGRVTRALAIWRQARTLHTFLEHSTNKAIEAVLQRTVSSGLPAGVGTCLRLLLRLPDSGSALNQLGAVLDCHPSRLRAFCSSGCLQSACLPTVEVCTSSRTSIADLMIASRASSGGIAAVPPIERGLVYMANATLARQLASRIRSGVRPDVFESVVSVLARSMQFIFASSWADSKLPGSILEFQEPVLQSVPRILVPDTVVGICLMFERYLETDYHTFFSVRDVCSNIVDLILAHMWAVCFEGELIKRGGNEPDAHRPDLVELGQHLGRLLRHPVEDVRVYVSRRLIDALEPRVVPEESSAAGLLLVLAPCADVSSVDLNIETSTAPATASQPEPEKWTYKCDVCGEPCEPAWWHCVDCVDVDICQGCVSVSETALPPPHTATHLLLCGVADADDPVSLRPPSASSDRDAVCREVFAAVAVEACRAFVDTEFAPDDATRLQQCASFLERMLNPPSLTSVRSTRIQSLFSPSVDLCRCLIKLLAEVDTYNWLASQTPTPSALRKQPRGICTSGGKLLVLLRLISSTRDPAMVPRFIRGGAVQSLSDALARLSSIYVTALDAQQNVGPITPASTSRGQDSGAQADQSGGALGVQPLDVDADVSETPLAEAICLMMEILAYFLECIAGHWSRVSVRSLPIESICAMCGVVDMSWSSWGEGSGTHRASGPRYDSVAVQDRARSLLLLAHSGDSDAFCRTMDLHTLQKHFEDLVALEEETNSFKGELSYSIQLRIARLTSSLLAISGARPRNLMSFLESDRQAETRTLVLQCLYGLVLNTEGVSRARALELFAHSVSDADDSTPDDPSSSAVVSVSGAGGPTAALVGARSARTTAGIQDLSKTEATANVAVHFLMSNDMERLKRILDVSMLVGSGRDAQAAGSRVLEALIEYATTRHDKALMDRLGRFLVTLALHMPVAGPASGDLARAMHGVVAGARALGAPETPWISDLGRVLSQILQDTTQFLASHPNSHLYKLLSDLIVLDEFYLESEPCSSCCEMRAEEEYALTGVDLVRAESKFTDSAIFNRLVAPQSITGVTVQITEPSRTRSVRSINVYYSIRAVADATELKSRDHPWNHAATIAVPRMATSATVEMDIPVVASNVMFEFLDFYGDPNRPRLGNSGANGAAGGSESATWEGLQCPRCSRQVTDRYGICRSCGENSFQCRACRNIMYEVLDGFLCNECGFCKHGRFDFSLLCTPSYATEPICSEEERKRASDVIERETNAIQVSNDQLKKTRSTLLRVMSGDPDEDIPVSGDAAVSPPFPDRSPGVLSTDHSGDMDISSMESILRSLAGEEIDILQTAVGVESSGPIPSRIASSLLEMTGHVRADDGQVLDDTGSSATTPSQSPPFTIQGPEGPTDGGVQMSRHAGQAAVLYSRDCRKIYNEMSKSVRTLVSAREELARYSGADVSRDISLAGANLAANDAERAGTAQDPSFEPGAVTPPRCFGCAQTCVAQSVPLLEAVLQGSTTLAAELADHGLAVCMLERAGLFYSRELKSAVARLVLHLILENPQSTSAVCAEVADKVGMCTSSVHSLDASSAASLHIEILVGMSRLDDSLWEERLRAVFALLLRTTDASLESSVVAEHIMLPCLQAAAALVGDAADIDIPRHEGTDEVQERNGDSQNADAALGTDSGGDGTGTRNESEILQGESAAPSIVDLRRNTKSHRDHTGDTVDFSAWAAGDYDFAKWLRDMKDVSWEAAAGRHSPSESNNAQDTKVLRRCLRRWRHACSAARSKAEWRRLAAQSPSGLYTAARALPWTHRLVLLSPCADVRSQSAQLLSRLQSGDDTLAIRLLDSLLAMPLELAAKLGPTCLEFFDLIEKLIQRPEHRMYLVARGFLVRIARLIEQEAKSLRLAEIGAYSTGHLNIFHGVALEKLVGLFRLILESLSEHEPGLRARVLAHGECDVVSLVLRAYLHVRGLTWLRTKTTDQCATALQQLLASPGFLFLSTGKLVVEPCVKEAEQALRDGDKSAIGTALALLCDLLCPEKLVPVYHLVLEKTSTQEEFIRGNMTRASYPSNEFDGPLMRDVKVKICQDLALTSLLEDDLGDFGLELLVAGNLISLDLPIAMVYERVWRGSSEAAQVSSGHLPRRMHGSRRGSMGRPRLPPQQSQEGTSGDPPMVVVFRLSGLDGEATENRIESLEDASTEAEDPESEYKATKVLGESGGLKVLLDLFLDLGSWGTSSEGLVRDSALRLLRSSCEVASNRAILSRTPQAISTLIDCATAAIERSHENPTAVEAAESLLIATEKILSEHGVDATAALPETPEDGAASAIDVGGILQRLHTILRHLEMATSKKAEAALLHLIPYLLHGHDHALQEVVQHFRIRWDDLAMDANARRTAKQLASILFSAPLDDRGYALGAALCNDGGTRRAAEQLATFFPYPKEQNGDTWATHLDDESPVLALDILRGVSRCLLLGSGGAAREELRGLYARDSMLPTLCQLDLAVSASGIGTAAEELLEVLEADEVLVQMIREERNKIRQARRQAAEASKAAMLRGIGSHSSAAQNGEDSAPVPSSVSEMFGYVEDELGPSCVVCGDGFTSRPDEALAVYTLSLRVSRTASRGEDHVSVQPSRSWSLRGTPQTIHQLLEGTAPPPRSRNTSSPSGGHFSNVTHFNAVHLECHREATRTDRSLRPPRDEWDGATLRNSQTKCNNLFPVMPPACFRTDESTPEGGDRRPSAAESSYEAAVDFYFGRLGSLWRGSAPHALLAIQDIASSISMFGEGSTVVFSAQSQGGGPESNLQLLPHVCQLAWHLLVEAGDDAWSVSAIHKRVVDYSNADDSESERPCFYLALAVLSCSRGSWDSILPAVIGRARTVAKSSDNSEDSESIPKMLRAFAFCEAFHAAVKCAGDDWIRPTRARLAVEESWLISTCASLCGQWESKICRLATPEQFLECLTEIRPDEESEPYLDAVCSALTD